MMEKILLFPSFREKGKFLWQTCFYAVVWGIWLERNHRIFREERFVRES